jgi:hypothetical protein
LLESAIFLPEVSAEADSGMAAVSMAADARSIVLIFMSLSLVAGSRFDRRFGTVPPRCRNSCCTEACVLDKSMMSENGILA